MKQNPPIGGFNILCKVKMCVCVCACVCLCMRAYARGLPTL